MKRLTLQPGGIRNLVLIVIVGIGLFLYFYTQHIINQLREETASVVGFYAQMHAKVDMINSPEVINFIFDEVITKTTFPLIQTDSEMEPVWWRFVPVDEDDRSDAAMKKLRRLVSRMAGEADPIPIMHDDTVLAYLVYGDSRLIQQLIWLPYIEVGVVGFFILVGFIGYASIKRSEQRHIWVGMAKETAHQLGTPLSSLLGWVEVMKSGSRINRKEIIGEMEKDIVRLNQVSHRFSQIGSKPDLKTTSIGPILNEIVSYIERRAPQAGKTVDIEEDYEENVTAAVNPFLFQWAVENLMKNSLDAIDKKNSRIGIRMHAEQDEKRIIIEIEDNGRGMDSRIRKRLFRPGFSTKERGWGLGLTLAKRIIEEYHGGRLSVRESRQGVGTVMRIEMKTV